MNTKPRLNQLAISLAIVILLSGCAVGEAVVGGVITTANRLDHASRQSRGEKARAQLLEKIQALQAKGDPQGDYLWTVANATGLVPNPELNPEVLLRMYQAAAAKGSIEAEAAVGVMLYIGATAPNRMAMDAELLPREQWNRAKALEILERVVKQRCWYTEPLLISISSENCLRPNSIAVQVWPEMRDGNVWGQDTAGFLKWKALDDQCKADPVYKQADRRCN